MDLAELQTLMDVLYGEADRARGVPATVAWLCEELGELAQAVRKGTREQQVVPFDTFVAMIRRLRDERSLETPEAGEPVADAGAAE